MLDANGLPFDATAVLPGAAAFTSLPGLTRQSSLPQQMRWNRSRCAAKALRRASRLNCHDILFAQAAEKL
jgi:hypothetical protein